MSDLPLVARDPLAQALLPRLLTPERELACDGGTTRKTLWRTFDGALVESVLMRYPEPGHDVRVVAGGAAAWPAHSARPGKPG